MVRSFVLFALATTLLAAGCAKGKADERDGGAPPDTSKDGPTPELSTPDGPKPDGRRDGPPADQKIATDKRVDTLPADTLAADLPPAPDIGASGPNVGAVCTQPSDCAGGTSCLLSLGGVTICTIAACTQDNPATAGTNEDTCPNLAKNICAAIPLSSGSTQNYCVQRCQPRAASNDCPAQLACDFTAGSLVDDPTIGVCTTKACKADIDCPVFTAKTCTSATGAGCSAAAGETCIALSSGDRCAVAGHCNTVSGMCEGHSKGTAGAKIGDPCLADVNCGNDQFCLREGTASGKTSWRGGYCTILGCMHATNVPKLACPSGSACNRAYGGINGVCMRSCTLATASTCRGRSGDFLGDYECYGWDGLTLNLDNKPVAATPVCDTPVPCNFFSGGCAALGLTPNSTNMNCRDLKNVTKTNPADPTGYCLDNTAAGPVN